MNPEKLLLIIKLHKPEYWYIKFLTRGINAIRIPQNRLLSRFDTRVFRFLLENYVDYTIAFVGEMILIILMYYAGINTLVQMWAWF